ncbi:conserved hypothetical protein [Leishmania mexicana MHOM/GT/2001/U1103]|uniref:Uncharacterized protein n=1 Tax=Leishmania mexicana (strain MHOM/GT/2001/U1103) TaxID=929439 RepID=E9AW18_LEIMU|nr:conserved hypothetical protein [Leishmania mexicana MHOM/GT/2001/U1103]CBZ27152.1 conserved hypothetical protein [Leishmania mexicana MHOM/GT/2001/U1103]
MGGKASKAGTALTPEAVDALYREAYAAGAADADMYHTSQREVMRQQDAMAGIGACMLSAWVAYVYGRTTGVQAAEEAAALRLDAQQQMLDRTSKDLAQRVEENRSLITVRQEQGVMIAQQRDELQRAAQQRRGMQRSMNALRQRNASVQRQMRSLKSSLSAIQLQMYVGMAGAALVLLAVVWSTRPLRKGHWSFLPVPASVGEERAIAASAPVAVVEAVEVKEQAES